MIKYLLDTNICIYLMKEQPPSVIKRFKHNRRGEIVISSVTLAELCCGLNIHNSQSQMTRLLREIDSIPFDTKAATTFGELYQSFPSRRKSTFDKMIAAHAISLDITLVTNNVADFSLYETCGLRLENWVA